MDESADWGTSSREEQTPSAPLTVKLTEFGTAEADQLSGGERITLDRRFRGFVDVAQDWRTGKFTLAASHYVGVVQIGRLRIRIEPKAPATNFFYMLTYANRVRVNWNEITELNDVDEILELIVRAFVEQVEKLLRRGVYRTYRAEEETRPFLRGRLLLAEQLRQSVNSPGRFAQRLHEYTSDVAENRILLWTLHRLERMPWRDPLLNRRIRRLEANLDEVALAPVTETDFEGLVYTRLNEGYRSPHRLARLLLHMRSIEGVEGQHHFSGWLLDMNKLFEQFVGVYLSEHAARESLPRYTVQLQSTLELGVNHSQTSTPDIVIRQGGRACAVMDTKHKVLTGTPSESDRRQLLEYAVNLHLHDGFLIYSSSTSASPSQPTHEFGGGWPFSLHSAIWSLDGTLAEFKARSSKTADWLLGRVAREPNLVQAVMPTTVAPALTSGDPKASM